ncbi:MAG: coat protein [Fushun naranga aenescens tombus-like virus 1]|nr:MAG: coat protein [Fushun naranga aenescens tombus-like virus 1]
MPNNKNNKKTVRRNLPRQTVRAARNCNTTPRVRISQSELFVSLKSTDDKHKCLTVSPTTLHSGFLRTMSSVYSKLMWDEITVSWRPAMGDNSNGLISYGFIPEDCSSYCPETRQEISSLPSHKDHPIWTQSSLRAPKMADWSSPCEPGKSLKFVYALDATNCGCGDIVGEFHISYCVTLAYPIHTAPTGSTPVCDDSELKRKNKELEEQVSDLQDSLRQRDAELKKCNTPARVREARSISDDLAFIDELNGHDLAKRDTASLDHARSRYHEAHRPSTPYEDRMNEELLKEQAERTANDPHPGVHYPEGQLPPNYPNRYRRQVETRGLVFSGGGLDFTKPSFNPGPGYHPLTHITEAPNVTTAFWIPEDRFSALPTPRIIPGSSQVYYWDGRPWYGDSLPADTPAPLAPLAPIPSGACAICPDPVPLDLSLNSALPDVTKETWTMDDNNKSNANLSLLNQLSIKEGQTPQQLVRDFSAALDAKDPGPRTLVIYRRIITGVKQGFFTSTQPHSMYQCANYRLVSIV